MGAYDEMAVDRGSKAPPQFRGPRGEVPAAFKKRVAEYFSVFGLGGAAIGGCPVFKRPNQLRIDVPDR